MALITMPSGLIQTVEWAFVQPGQATQSSWTGRSKEQPSGHAWFEARVVVRPLFRTEIYAYRRFLSLAGLKGNTFRLDAVEEDQSSLTTVLVNGGGQTGYSLITDGWGGAGTKLLAGQFITIANQLIMLSSDVTADSGGNATLSLASAIRSATAENAPVEVKRPYGLMRIPDTRVGWSVSPGRIYGSSFSCVEAF